MNSANAALLESAAKLLGELLDEVVFLGGTTIELWITDPAAPEFRPTQDVDVIVEITTLTEFHRFEKRLREQRFEHDQESGLICRYKYPEAGLILDVMPMEPAVLGFENHWQNQAFPHAIDRDLPSGRTIRAIPPTYLLATKIEAFGSRGKGDFYGSRDFQDIVALIDGREELPGELAGAPNALREFVADELEKLTGDQSFDSGIQGALLPGPETQERAELVVRPRIMEIIAARPRTPRSSSI
jgi:hypothetical protein